MIDGDLLDFAKKIYQPLENEYLQNVNSFSYGVPRAFYGKNREKTEAWMRPLWLISSLADLGLVPDKVLYKIVNGIGMGVNEKSEYYWGDIDNYDQIIVELASLSFFIIKQPSLFKSLLTKDDLYNIESYLNQVNNVSIPNNNWVFFRILINTALKKIDLRYSSTQITNDLNLLHSLYKGGGWYSDGGRFDYYNAWAFHFYGLIYAKEIKEHNPKLYVILVDRAQLFAKDYCQFFEPNSGTPIPFGRSMLYRFCTGSFYSALLYLDDPGINNNEMFRQLKKQVSFWQSQDIVDDKGFLSLGFTYPNESFLEDYNGFGSAYWATKLFICLPMSRQEAIETYNKNLAPKIKSVVINGTLLLRNGILYPTNQEVFEKYGLEKYLKFAYSYRSGFSIDNDNHLVVSIDKDVHKSGLNIRSFVNKFFLFREWNIAEGVRIKTLIIPFSKSHLRIHHIKNKTKTSIKVDDYGFCHPTKLGAETASRSLMSSSKKMTKHISRLNLLQLDCYITSISSIVKKQRIMLNYFTDK